MPVADRRDQDLAVVDLPERRLDHRPGAVEPACIAPRHSGQPAADLCPHRRNARGLGFRKLRYLHHVGLGRPQTQDHTVVGKPFARQAGEIE